LETASRSSTSVTSPSSPAPSAPDVIELPNLENLVQEYAGEVDLPVEWLTRLRLDRPRTNLHELGRRTRIAKRTIDILLSITAILILAPAALAVAALVKLTSPGPAVFKQIRIGLNLRKGDGDRRRRSRALRPGPEGRDLGGDRRRRHSFGRPFVIYKFRTMVADAEKGGARLAARNDPRVTPVGRFLRRTRLDEILQFVNVLRGEMSIVGPRPERPEFISKLSRQIPGYLGRLGLKPGITGLAQILNGYDEDLESVRRKVALDLLYLQNACIRNDLKILLRTVKVVLTGSGAR